MTDEWWAWKDLEGSGYVLIKASFQHLPGGAEENDKETQPQIPALPAWIWTKHLQNRSLESYYYKNLLSQ
jgi:hypothetical protein